MVFAVVLATLIGGMAPQSIDQLARLDRQVADETTMTARVVRHWAGRAPAGAPARDFPNRFSVAPQYEGSVTRDERLQMGRRLRAIADLVLAQPTLQGPDIVATFDPPSLHRLRMNDGEYLSMGVTFRLQQGGDLGTIGVSLTLERDRMDEWREVGRTSGGCRREQKIKGAGTGGEVYRLGAEGPTSGTRIRGVEVVRGAYINPRLPFGTQADGMAGRITAAVETLDCEKLLALANLP